MITVKKSVRANSLIQSYSAGWQYAPVSSKADGYRMLSNFMTCKDYFQDIIWASYAQKATTVFGMTYSPSVDPPLDRKTTRLVVFNDQRPKFDEFYNAAALVKAVEAKLHWKRTRVYEVSVEGCECKAVMYEGDPRWMHAPPLISLYTSLLRSGYNYDPTKDKCVYNYLEKITRNTNYRDRSNLSVFGKEMAKKLFYYGTKLFKDKAEDNYLWAISGSTVHSFGILAWSNQQVYKQTSTWCKKLSEMKTMTA